MLYCDMSLALFLDCHRVCGGFSTRCSCPVPLWTPPELQALRSLELDLPRLATCNLQLAHVGAALNQAARQRRALLDDATIPRIRQCQRWLSRPESHASSQSGLHSYDTWHLLSASDAAYLVSFTL